MSAWYLLAWPAMGGSLVNQISTYRPLALLLTGNVTVPPTSAFCATVVMELANDWEALSSAAASEVEPLFVCGAGTDPAGVPSLISTVAPGIAPNVTVTDDSLTA